MPEFWGGAAVADAVVVTAEFFGLAEVAAWVGAGIEEDDADAAALADALAVGAAPALEVSAIAPVCAGVGLVAERGVAAEGSLSTGVAPCRLDAKIAMPIATAPTPP